MLDKNILNEEDFQPENPDYESSGSGLEEEEDLQVTVIGPGINDQENGEENIGTTNDFNCPTLGIHPAPTCDSFYMCSKVGIGGASLQTCGAGLHFDTSLKACNWPVHAKCSHSLAAARFYTGEM